MKSIVRLAASLTTLSLLTGCLGTMADVIGRPMVTGETYGKMEAALSSHRDGDGRLYIYRTEASNKVSFDPFLYGFYKVSTVCTVGRNAYEVTWEVFRYIDLPEGEYEVTCGDDILANCGRFYGNPKCYQKGNNRVWISVANGADSFVRVDRINEKPYFRPVLVEGELARKEMLELPYEKRIYEHQDGEMSQQ